MKAEILRSSRLALVCTLILSGTMAAAAPVHAAPVEAVLDHTEFDVADLNRSIRFYTDHLGFRLARRVDMPAGKGPGSDHEGLSAAFLQLGSETLELVQHGAPGEHPNPAGPENRLHLGLVLKDVRAAYSQLSAQGVKFDGPPVLKARNGSYTVQMRDPDGVRLELLEAPGASADR